MLSGIIFVSICFQSAYKSTADHEHGRTESSKRPVHSSPGLKVIDFSTAAPSTHSICLYSSSPKSTMDLDFLSQGFQTTMQCQIKK